MKEVQGGLSMSYTVTKRILVLAGLPILDTDVIISFFKTPQSSLSPENAASLPGSLFSIWRHANLELWEEARGSSLSDCILRNLRFQVSHKIE